MMSLWDALRMNMMISYQELVRTFLSSGRWISGEAYIWCDTIFHHVEVSIPVELEFPLVGYFIFQNPCLHKSQT
ncbi:hypothetical protein D0Z05_01620 (plasmid) [Enterobacter hormaechei]|nr:hypothetical protein D0Z05_01620 [Enterobacter hormaechei]